MLHWTVLFLADELTTYTYKFKFKYLYVCIKSFNICLYLKILLRRLDFSDLKIKTPVYN